MPDEIRIERSDKEIAEFMAEINAGVTRALADWGEAHVVLSDGVALVVAHGQVRAMMPECFYLDLTEPYVEMRQSAGQIIEGIADLKLPAFEPRRERTHPTSPRASMRDRRNGRRR